MALNGILRPGYIQIRVTDMAAALGRYVDGVGLHEVSREPDGRAYLIDSPAAGRRHPVAKVREYSGV